jgi:hypothetical protein
MLASCLPQEVESTVDEAAALGQEELSEQAGGQ